jgi:hypothetical protein
MTRVAVAHLKYSTGFEPGREEKAKPNYQVLELRHALERVYTSDAHLVTYVVDGLEKQPRINKTGLQHYMQTTGRRLAVECFFCDVDNPGHAPWTDELYMDAVLLDSKLEILSTAGIYHTRGGRRIVQPLATPLDVEAAEPHLKYWLIRLADAGLAVDFECKDWTRHYRVPYVRRDGVDERPAFIDLTRMRPVELPPLPAVPLDDLMPPWARRKRAKASGSAQPFSPTDKIAFELQPSQAIIPKHWQPVVAPVAGAIASVLTPWHGLFLTLAGAMLRLRIPPESIEALVESISLATHADDRTQDRVKCARSTLERYSRGESLTGLSALRAEWPEVARALESAVAMVRLGPAGRSPNVAADTRSLTEITTALEAAIEQAPVGLTVIKAECGLGKTYAALRVAARRAVKSYASEHAAGLRAPTDSKTAISVDKNKLAIQCATELETLGRSSQRIFGPLSLLDANGTPICKLHKVATPLVEGGQRMQWELCERRNGEAKCKHYDECPARTGQEGDSRSRITFGTHSLLGALDAEAGSTGLLVIDEVPEFLETVALNAEDLEAALLSAGTSFEATYVAALIPVLSAWFEFLKQAPEGESVEASEAARRFAHRIPPHLLAKAQRSALLPSDADAVECAAHTPFPEKHCGTAPPILKHWVDIALEIPGQAARLGKISKVLKITHHAMASEYPVVVRVEERRGKRQLLVTSPREVLAQALRRDGAVVVADANADLHLPILSQVVGYEPRYHVFTAPDGAPIRRTMIRTRKATRKAWFRAGKLDPESSLVEFVRAAFAWLEEDPSTALVGIVTVPAVECVLLYAAGIDEPKCLADWKSMGQPREALDAFSAVLAPTLDPWRPKLLTAHYGATRGLNDMSQADALITLGDPWTNLGDARSDAAFLQLGADWEARYTARCRAELEQAHGRLRTVHRTEPARALHVGAVMPGGSGWAIGRVDVRESSRDHRTADHAAHSGEAMTAEQFAQAVNVLGGLRAASRILGCSRGTVANYRIGKRRIPDEIAERVLRATRQA